MADRPETTLYMLMSVDGKISTGASDELDFDSDLTSIEGVKEGLFQYYEIEQTTDLWSFNTGRVQAKIGVNEKPLPSKTLVSFVLWDNSHLKESGVRYFCAKSENFYLITSNKDHPAFHADEKNLHIIFQEKQDLSDALKILKERYSCKRMTIQSGGTLNSILLKEKLIDHIDIVVAPLLVGGKDTPSLVDGLSLMKKEQLHELCALKLTDCIKLKDSYIRLTYDVIS
ncbi:MAG: dihydrofolate reductase family protein [Erysipelotrichaceae bacterium]|nr:dihydrofolate reductase family protein [Erysipelotrichaceae bacterium]